MSGIAFNETYEPLVANLTTVALKPIPIVPEREKYAVPVEERRVSFGRASHPEKNANKNWLDLPAEDIRFEIVENSDQLSSLVPAWKRLAELSLDPNIFYEPAVLIPALDHLRNDNIRIVVATAGQRRSPEAPRVLCGLFPLEIHRHYRGIPIRSATLWRHLHCFLTTPLVRADVAQEVLQGFFNFVAQAPLNIGLLDFDTITGDGPFQEELIDALRATRCGYQLSNIHRRALFVPAPQLENFLGNWPRKRRQEITRLERRLSEQGNLTTRIWKSPDPIGPWIDSFLDLERNGWKGSVGTAIGSSDAEQSFFRDCVTRLALEQRLQFLSLELDGIPLAMKCNFLSHDGGFSFKIAFNEAFAKSSPGTVLEKRTVEILHESCSSSRVRWMDSCAAPDHPMIDSLWQDRRTIQSLVIATHRRGAAAALSLVPLLKWARNQMRGSQTSSQ